MINLYDDAVLSKFIITGNKPNDLSDAANEGFPNTIQKLPTLTNFGIRCVSKFRGEEEYFENQGGEHADLLQELAVTVQLTGADVLNGLSNLASNSSATYFSNNNVPSGYFEEPLPSWLQGAACRGRNVLEIRTGKRKIQAVSGGNAPIVSDGTCTALNLQQEDDAMSIAASELTDVDRPNRTNFHKKSPRRTIHTEATAGGENKRSLLKDNRKRGYR